MIRWALLVALALGTFPVAAADGGDGLAWLQRVASAARTINYAGTFVYQHGNRVESSRIVHLVDESGEHEKLETLDGPPREIVRHNDEIYCYFPEGKQLRIDKGQPRKTFPALLPEQLSSLTENYHVRLGGRERIAGYECQVILLEPKDGLRYGHKLWADAGSGLLLKAIMFDDRGRVVEQFAFTQVEIGRPIDPALLKPKYEARTPLRQEAIASGLGTDRPSGWVIRDPPPGFKKVLEARRLLGAKPRPVIHIMLSDGLVAVSVFVEAVGSNPPKSQRHSNQGAINIVSRVVNNHLVTVVGEAPAVTVMKIADSITYQDR
jgi:sigma-E factor negative regulatory protein RseB